MKLSEKSCADEHSNFSLLIFNKKKTNICSFIQHFQFKTQYQLSAQNPISFAFVFISF